MGGTRPVIDNSGWWHVKTGIADFHWYTADLQEWDRGLATLREKGWPRYFGSGIPFELMAPGYGTFGGPIVNGEYGVGRGDRQRTWHLRPQTNLMRKHPDIVGYVYTEHYDVELGLCGFYRYDREAKHWDAEPNWVNSLDYIVVDMLPVDEARDLAVRPGEAFRVPLLISHYGPPLGAGARIVYALGGTDIHGELPVSPVRWTVTPGGEIHFAVPDAPGLHRLLIRLQNRDGRVTARNLVTVSVEESCSRDRWSRP